MGRRRQAREFALQALYLLDAGKMSGHEALLIVSADSKLDARGEAFARELVLGAEACLRADRCDYASCRCGDEPACGANQACVVAGATAPFTRLNALMAGSVAAITWERRPAEASQEWCVWTKARPWTPISARSVGSSRSSMTRWLKPGVPSSTCRWRPRVAGMPSAPWDVVMTGTPLAMASRTPA